MRFACESCRTRYTLADEKVRGRVLRVRCKTCGASMVVREGGAETVVGDSPGPVRSGTSPTPPQGVAPALPPTPAGAEWFAMVKGKQEGPFDQAALAARVRDGTIGPRTFLWCEALPDWKRASELPALKALLDAAAPSAEPASFRSVTPTPSLPPAGAPEPAPVKVAQPETVAPPQAPTARPVSPSLAELLADLPVPSAEHSLPLPAAHAGQSNGEFTQMVMMRAGLDARGHKKRTARLLLVGGGFVAVAGLVFLLLPTSVLPSAPKAAGGKAPKELAPWTQEGMESLRDTLLGRDMPRRAQGSSSAARGGRPRDEGAVIHRTEKQAQAVSASTQDELAQLYGDPSKRDARVETRNQGDAPKADKAALDPQAISKTVTENSSAYKRCIDDYLRRNPNFRGGKVEITATIAPSGIVTSAAISDRTVEATDLGACLRDRTKRIIFPRFEGDAFDVTYPLLLGSSGG